MAFTNNAFQSLETQFSDENHSTLASFSSLSFDYFRFRRSLSIDWTEEMEIISGFCSSLNVPFFIYGNINSWALNKEKIEDNIPIYT